MDTGILTDARTDGQGCKHKQRYMYCEKNS